MLRRLRYQSARFLEHLSVNFVKLYFSFCEVKLMLNFCELWLKLKKGAPCIVDVKPTLAHHIVFKLLEQFCHV